MDKRREVLEKLVEGKYNYTDPRVKKDKMDIALTALDKLEKEKINGAYKQGYHDALNSRPYKVNL